MSARRGVGFLTHRLVASSALAIASLAFAACGPSLETLATQAMDACLEVRNPLFISGRGSTAIDTPLPAGAEVIAVKLNYVRAFRIFKGVAEGAQDQATLVCALDLASRYSDGEAKRFVARYLKHPSPDVAAAAQVLLDRRR